MSGWDTGDYAAVALILGLPCVVVWLVIRHRRPPDQRYGATPPAYGSLAEGDGDVQLLNCPFDVERHDLFYVGEGGNVFHVLWRGGAIEDLGGAVAVGTLTATWTPDGNAIYVAGVAHSPGGTPNTGQYWGMTLDRYGNRSGWGTGQISTPTVHSSNGDRASRRVGALLAMLGVSLALLALAVMASIHLGK